MNKKLGLGKNFTVLLFLFFINPFSAFLISLFNYNKKESLYIFALFTFYYGLNVRPSLETDDLFFYLNVLPFYHSLPFSSFFLIMSGYLSQTAGSEVDIYRNFIFFTVSRFTDNGHVLMSVFGLFYGILFSLSISHFIKQSNRKSLFLVLILIAFSFQVPLNALGGVRFGTASYLFFYGAIKFINDSKPKNFLIASLSVLVHFHFLILTILLLIHYFVKKFRQLYYVFFAISFFNFNIPAFIGDFWSDREGGLADRAVGYTREDAVERKFTILQSAAWQVKGQWLLQEFFFYLLVTLQWLKKSFSFKMTEYSSNVFYFALLLYSFANLVRGVPSLGERTLAVSLMFIMYFLYVFQKDNMKNLLVRGLSILAFFAAGIRIAISFRAILFSLDTGFYIGNFFN